MFYDTSIHNNTDECIVHASCYLICNTNFEKRTSVIYSDYNEYTNGWCIFMCNNSISLVVGKCKFWEGISFVSGPTLSLNKWHHILWIINPRLGQLSIELDNVKVHIGDFNGELDVLSCIRTCYVTNDSGVCIRDVVVNGARPVILPGKIKDRVFCVHNPYVSSKIVHLDIINEAYNRTTHNRTTHNRTTHNDEKNNNKTLHDHIINMYTNATNENAYKLIKDFETVIRNYQVDMYSCLRELDTEEKTKLECLIDRFILTHLYDIQLYDIQYVNFENVLKAVI